MSSFLCCPFSCSCQRWLIWRKWRKSYKGVKMGWRSWRGRRSRPFLRGLHSLPLSITFSDCLKWWFNICSLRSICCVLCRSWQAESVDSGCSYSTAFVIPCPESLCAEGICTTSGRRCLQPTERNSIVKVFWKDILDTEFNSYIETTLGKAKDMICVYFRWTRQPTQKVSFQSRWECGRRRGQDAGVTAHHSCAAVQ